MQGTPRARVRARPEIDCNGAILGAAIESLPVAIQSGEHLKKKSAVFSIPSLDGLRAVSFLIVFVAHSGFELVPGGFGVTVFFFLSGFLITTLMRIEDAKTGAVSLKHFYLRRLLRILPPFYLVLLIAISIALMDPSLSTARPNLSATMGQVFHFSNYWIAYHGWGGLAAGTGVYWSLAVEEHFYLIFPASYVLLRRLGLTAKQKSFVLLGVCGAVFCWRCVLIIALNSNSERTYVASDTRFDSILFGCALALWNNPALDHSKWSAGRIKFWRNYLFPAALGVLILTFAFRNSVFRETARYTIQGLALVPIFVTAVLCSEWSVFRVLNHKALRFIGTLSYSLYLVHHAVIFLVARDVVLPTAVHALISLTISIAFSWGLYVAVERPCAVLRRRLSSVG